MGKTLQAGKLIVGGIAVCVDPTGAAITTLGIDTDLQIKEWFQSKPDLAKLSKDLDAQFHTTLKTDYYAKPDDARNVLPQMLADAFPSVEQIAQCGLFADEILREMHKTLGAIESDAKRKEYQRTDIVRKFDALVLPLLKTACDDTRLIAVLQPALVRAQKVGPSNPRSNISTRT